MSFLRGAFTAMITPFTTDGAKVDVARLRAAVERQALAGIDGVVPCGTTGETPTLSESEMRAVVEAVIAEASSLGLTVIAGAGANDTKTAVTRHRFACEAGADAALQVCPYYNRPTQEGLYRHFMMIADACDLPVVLYDVPGRTGTSLSIETIERLAEHPNIQAIKDATGSLAAPLRILQRTDLVILSGDDPLTLASMSVGAAGVISVLSNLVPDRVARLVRMAAAEEYEPARRVHHELLPLAESILGTITNPIGIKTAMELLRLDTGAMRLPLCAAPDDVRTKIIGALMDAGLLDEPQPVGSPGHMKAKIAPVTRP